MIPSPLNSNEVAEQALIKFLIKEGVFTPPTNQTMFHPLFTSSRVQTIDVPQLLHATVKFIRENSRNPKVVNALLIEEMKHNSQYL